MNSAYPEVLRPILKKLSKTEKLDTRNVVIKLQMDEPLGEKSHDHELRGNYAGFRECYVHPDLLLAYKKLMMENFIYFL